MSIGDSPQAVVDALFRLARDSEVLKTAPGVKEARINLLEAHRLSNAMSDGRVKERMMMEYELRAGA